MSAQEEVTILDYIKQKVQKSREETTDIVNTLFTSGMQEFPQLFMIVEEYSVGPRPVKCDVYVSGEEDVESVFAELFQKVSHRHSDMYKITEIFEKDLKINEDNPISYLKGYLVQNKTNIIPFSAFSPRPKKEFIWTKKNLLSKMQVESLRVKRADEVETDEYYYQLSISQDPLSEKQIDDIKLHIVKSIYRELSFNDEVYLFRKMEVTWRNFEQTNAISVDQFESFIKELYTFKEASTPEVKPAAETLYHSIVSRKSLMNQYEMIRKYNDDRPIWIH